MKESYLIECLEKFHDLPDQIQEMVGGFEACLKIKKIEDAYGVSLSFAVLLVAINELSINDLTDYLNLKFKIDKVRGREIAYKLEQDIFSPVLSFIENDINEEVLKEAQSTSQNGKFGTISGLSVADQKELILDTFSGDIVGALKAEPSKIKELNIIIFKALNSDEGLDDEMQRLLYINQEKISNHHIILDGHPASPSIANWLKDFIKKYGSDIFNDVTLIEYLTQSLNVKVITPEEKELVRKVLKLYRNLVFFPESMENVPLEHWEIFPIDRNTNPVKEDLLSDEPPAPEVVETPVISDRQKIIFDLQKSLTRYPATSLEYKAIHQEINRLSHK
jgi:hypothetical protein